MNSGGWCPDSWRASLLWSHFCLASVFTNVKPSGRRLSSSSISFTPCSPSNKRLLCIHWIQAGIIRGAGGSSSILAFFCIICIVTAKSTGKRRRSILQRTSWRFGHVSAINISRRCRAEMPAKFLHMPLWKNVPSGVATRLPSTDTGFRELWSRLWKFHCFLWLQQIAPKCSGCKKKTMGVLAAA